MTICLLTSMFCVAAVPASAGGFSIVVCGLSDDGCEWGIGIYDDFEEAWNEATYYAVNLEEAWNSAERYETEEERENGAKGFVRIIVYLYDDWNATDGVFGSGYGFMDGAIYVPADAKLTVNLDGHTINGSNANGTAIYIDESADVTISGGVVTGKIDAHKKAKSDVYNVYATADLLSGKGSAVRYGSIFGEGSLTMIVAILALISSAVAICISVTHNKKSAGSADTKDEDDE